MPKKPRAASREAWQAKRDTFLQDLLVARTCTLAGAANVPEIDAVLAEHLAQLRNAVRYTMQTAIDDGSDSERRTSPLRPSRA